MHDVFYTPSTDAPTGQSAAMRNAVEAEESCSVNVRRYKGDAAMRHLRGDEVLYTRPPLLRGVRGPANVRLMQTFMQHETHYNSL